METSFFRIQDMSLEQGNEYGGNFQMISTGKLLNKPSKEYLIIFIHLLSLYYPFSW